MHEPPEGQVVAGRIAREAVRLGIALCRDTISGTRLDQEIETFIRDEGGIPALKGYQPSFSPKPYEHAICLAVDNEAVHGVPIQIITPDHLITIDLVVRFEEWFADTARTFTHGNDPIRGQFVSVSKMILEMGLEAIAPHQPIHLFGNMVANAARTQGHGVVIELCGHGIGKTIHQHPPVLNYCDNSSEVFEPGCAYAVEPVLAIQPQYSLTTEKNGWTMTAECLTSHNEDTVFVSDNKVINLTGENNE